MLSLSTISGLGIFAFTYATYSLVVSPQPLPGATLAAWFGFWYWFPNIGLIPFILLLFPTGHLLSRRWRIFAWLPGLAVGGLSLLTALSERLEGEGFSIANPIGISGLNNVEEGTPGDIAGLMFLAAAVGAVGSLVVRFRRSRGVERQQLKWFTYAAAILLAGAVVGELGSQLGLALPEVMEGLFFEVPLAFLPIAIGIAILRYRLFEIDRVINRTIVYSVLTVVLVGLYVALVIVLQTLLRPLTPSSDLAIVASTLAVAAIFNTARRRVQAFVDRRFYRRKYDAQRTLDSFSLRLRDEVDMNVLVDDVRDVLNETLQPRHLGIWISQSARLTGSRR